MGSWCLPPVTPLGAGLTVDQALRFGSVLPPLPYFKRSSTCSGEGHRQSVAVLGGGPCDVCGRHTALSAAVAVDHTRHDLFTRDVLRRKHFATYVAVRQTDGRRGARRQPRPRVATRTTNRQLSHTHRTYENARAQRTTALISETALAVKRAQRRAPPSAKAKVVRLVNLGGDGDP